MNRGKQWFDDDKFWEEMYPFMFSPAKFSEAVTEIDQLLSLTGLSSPDVLDLCCGPGRCSIALAQRGCRVTGVDRTKFLLEKAQSRADETGADIEWVLADMRDFVRPEAFDLVISMFTSFGYFDDKQDDMKVLSRVYDSLRPGGIFLIDIMGKERLARVFQHTTSSRLEDGTRLVQIHDIADDWTRICNEWILIRGNRAKSFFFQHTLYSGQELKDRMEQAGFTGIKLCGGLDGSPYGPDSIRLIAAGKKP